MDSKQLAQANHYDHVEYILKVVLSSRIHYGFCWLEFNQKTIGLSTDRIKTVGVTISYLLLHPFHRGRSDENAWGYTNNW